MPRPVLGFRDPTSLPRARTAGNSASAFPGTPVRGDRQIADGREDIAAAGAAAVLDRLEAKGWIERIKDPVDGRCRRIRLTAKGEEVWARMLRSIEAFYAAALDGFSLDEQVQLYGLLNKLSAV